MTLATTPRPLWRYAIFCVTLDLWVRFDSSTALRVMRWTILPEWVGL